MTEPRVVGIDPSLTATGVAHWWGELHTYTPRKGLTGVARIRDIRAQLYTCTQSADFVVIEGPAYSRQLGAGHHEAAGLWWAIVDLVHTRGTPYAVVPPTTLKRYATGKGNATKPDMRVAWLKRTGEDVRDDNAVDAAWLRAMGMNHLGCPVVEVPNTHRAALGKVAWPEVTA